jgi:uncharacterized membrane protein
MKKYFITGLIILLPLALTIVIVVFIINFLTQPFVGFFESFISDEPWFAKYEGLIHFGLKILLLIFLFFATVLLGILTRLVIFKSLLSIYDFLLHRIPIIKSVYKATQQVIKTIFGSKSESFKQVVMVPFPTADSWCIGLISSSAPRLCLEAMDDSLLTVFVPTTPNPTSGFLMMYKRSQVTFIDMKIEDALKYIISCGVISSEEPNPFLTDL